MIIYLHALRTGSRHLYPGSQGGEVILHKDVGELISIQADSIEHGPVRAAGAVATLQRDKGIGGSADIRQIHLPAQVIDVAGHIGEGEGERFGVIQRIYGNGAVLDLLDLCGCRWHNCEG